MSPLDDVERDWRIFRELRVVALERLCERALRDAGAVLEDSSRSSTERFRALYDLIRESDARISRGFDDPKRSEMRHQLSFLVKLGLLEAGELARFSAETREKVAVLSELG